MLADFQPRIARRPASASTAAAATADCRWRRRSSNAAQSAAFGLLAPRCAAQRGLQLGDHRRGAQREQQLERR